MIIVSIITLIFSYLVQGIISNYLGYTYANLSIFSTLYVLISLLVIRPYFENEKKYLLLLIVFGLLMDISYTSTFILNTCFFIIVYYFSKVFHFFFPYNFFTINISSIFCVFIYHILTFLFLLILKYDTYSIQMLFKILTHSVIMTLLYTSFIYFITTFIQKKLELKGVK